MALLQYILMSFIQAYCTIHINEFYTGILHNEINNSYKKSLKIRKWWSESVNRRRTDNSMTKRKRTNNDLQNTTQKTTDRATGSVSSSCSTNGTRRVTLYTCSYKPSDKSWMGKGSGAACKLFEQYLSQVWNFCACIISDNLLNNVSHSQDSRSNSQQTMLQIYMIHTHARRSTTYII